MRRALCPRDPPQYLVDAFEPHSRNDRQAMAPSRSSTRFSLTLQQASPRVSFVVLFVLSRSRWLPLLGWNLKMASVSSTSVRPPSVGCASPRSAMTVNPLRPLRFWRPLRRPVLFSPLRYDRSGYAHRFLMWCIYSVVSNLGVLGERTFYPQTCFAVFSRSLDSYLTHCMSRPLWLLKSLSNGGAEIWYSFQREVHRTIVAMLTERLLYQVCQASCFIAGDVRL